MREDKRGQLRRLIDSAYELGCAQDAIGLEILQVELNNRADDLAAMQELTAVTGLELTEEWVLIGLVDWPGVEGYEMGLCWRRKLDNGDL
jgi:hypothetical protein